MLEANTDRMWFTIGSILIGAALVTLFKTQLNVIVASVFQTMESQAGLPFSNEDQMLVKETGEKNYGYEYTYKDASGKSINSKILASYVEITAAVELNDDKTNYTKNDGVGLTKLDIPEKIDGLPVKSIKERAFVFSDFKGEFDAKNLEKIGTNAFYSSNYSGPFDAKKLKTIGEGALIYSRFTGAFNPKELTSIGNDVFQSSNFTSFVPGKLKTIGNNVFRYSPMRDSFNAGIIETIGDSAFESANFTGSIDLKKIKSIGEKGFRNALFSGILDAKDLTNVGADAFYASNFTGTFNTKKLKGINAQAFYNSQFTGTLTISKQTAFIQKDAFRNGRFTAVENQNNLNVTNDENTTSGIHTNAIRMDDQTYYK